MIFKDLSPIEALTDDLDALARLLPASLLPVAAPRLAPRSALMVSAHRIKHLNKIDELAADLLMINLEDGVAAIQKPLARHLAALFIASAPESVRARCVVRVNPLGKGGEEDIALIAKAHPGAIRLPKVTSPDEVRWGLSLLPEGCDLHLSIETKEAFTSISSLVIDVRVRVLYLGILDLLADLGLSQALLRQNNPTIDYILAKFLIETKVAGAVAMGFVYQDHTDIEGFRAWAAYLKSMGYEGMGVISPKQVEIANVIFSPDANELQRAREIKELFEASLAQGESGFAHPEYGFIDEPIYKDALACLARNGEN
ncbi:MAG: CoA ester lyase [Campylobacterales bacterium]